MTEGKPSEMVVDQRVRNRIIDYLKVASSSEDQRQYQKAVPYVSVPNEMINQWLDWVADEENPIRYCHEPVFSSEELKAMCRFHEVWNEVSKITPTPLPPLEELFAHPAWERLRQAAGEAFAIFAKRGKLSDD